MGLNDPKKDLRGAKFPHLTEDELDSYLARQLDDSSWDRAEAHLKLCLICEGRLSVLREESAALKTREISAEDIALAKLVMHKVGLQQKPPDPIAREASAWRGLPDRLTEYLGQSVANWQAHFPQLKPERGAVKPGEEVWQWESEDSALKVSAISGDTGDLTIHFSSNELNWEGAKLKFRLSSVSRETILIRVSESELHATVEISRLECPRDYTDISIEKV